MFQYGRIKGEWWVWFLDELPCDFMGPFQSEEGARTKAKKLAEEFPMMSGGEWGRGADED